jgi:hypothetical protein
LLGALKAAAAMKRAASGDPSANRKPAKTKFLAKFTISDESEGEHSDAEYTSNTPMASSSSAAPGDLPAAGDAASPDYDMELETEHSKASLGPAGAGAASASSKRGATSKGKGRPARPMGSVAWM